MNTMTTIPQQRDQLPAATETAGQAVASRARAMIEARFTMAQYRPRDIDAVRQRLLKECDRPFFAAQAMYAKPVGGNKVTGPSIRFAETAIRCMTNIDVISTTTYDDEEKRIVNVSVIDLEANTGHAKDVTIMKTVERRKPKDGDDVIRVRQNSFGENVSIIVAGDDEVVSKEANLISKAVRTLALRLIPGDLIDEAKYRIKETLRKEDARDPDRTRIDLYDAFLEIGVKVEALKEYLGHDGAVLNPKELEDLRGLYVLIRDGQTTIRQVLEARKPAADADNAGGGQDAATLAEKLRQKGAEAAAAGAQAAQGAKRGGGKAKAGETAPADAAAAPAADEGAGDGADPATMFQSE